ncbi:MAG: WG repeat-containing protein, partial [Spirochaetales bacterium]|nr:WG repeat-containing protein [Spirochaetales bacterium]
MNAKKYLSVSLLCFITSVSFCEELLLPVYYGERFGYIDSQGKMVIEPIYISAGEFCEGFAKVAVYEADMSGHSVKWTFINADGEQLTSPKYEEVKSFCNGYARVCIGGLWGYIDKTGKQIIKCDFDDCWDFSEHR